MEPCGVVIGVNRCIDQPPGLCAAEHAGGHLDQLLLQPGDGLHEFGSGRGVGEHPEAGHAPFPGNGIAGDTGELHAHVLEEFLGGSGGEPAIEIRRRLGQQRAHIDLVLRCLDQTGPAAEVVAHRTRGGTRIGEHPFDPHALNAELLDVVDGRVKDRLGSRSLLGCGGVTHGAVRIRLKFALRQTRAHRLTDFVSGARQPPGNTDRTTHEPR
ncbi:unannotated protein [freshwater metagenome]|uniref:Unannotated protein n=1 Tax=freshwater metagenome TaxID=449393 RepID=A0A6J7KI82_9ZZZZ